MLDPLPVAGALVAGNLYLDLKRAGRPVSRDQTLRGATVHSLRVVGMFALVSVFWSCWNAPAVFAYFRAQLAEPARLLSGAVVVLLALLAAVGAGVVAQLVRRRLRDLRLLPVTLSPDVSAAGLTAVLAVAGSITQTLSLRPDLAGTGGTEHTVQNALVLLSAAGASAAPTDDARLTSSASPGVQ